MTCRAEAPEVERFARQTQDRLEIVGLGSNGDVDAAREFVASVGPDNSTMLFDEAGDSWGDLGIAGQPAAILFAAGGRELQRWIGPLDFDSILAALGP